MAACVLLATAGARAADNPADKYIAEIISGAKTNSARAAKLVEAAKILRGQPKVFVAVLEKAVQFGTKSPVTPAGCKAAGDALDLLEAEFPDRKDEWALKRADTCRTKYRGAKTRSEKQAVGREFLAALLIAAEIYEKSGNWTGAATRYREAGSVDAQVKAGKASEIRRKLKAATHFTTVAKKVAQYAAFLKKDPSKASTRGMLVKLLVVELNDPKQALPYLNEDVDEKWRTYVPLAAKNLDDLAEANCLELGQWYHKELSKSASLTGKRVLLRRAKDYYKQFVELQTKEDIQTFRAKAALKSIEKELKKLGAPAIRVSRPVGRTLILDLGNGVRMKVVLIPAGSFIMGSPKSEANREDDEGPQHKVTISKGFYMGITEVTQKQYTAVTGKNPSTYKAPQSPVETVSWDDAVAFCKKLSATSQRTVRLPTEAEWEYACRAGTRARFFWGSNGKEFGTYAWSGGGKPHAVGQKKPNRAGLYDMLGNVWEWCADWYDAKYYSTARSVRDPKGPDSGEYHVIRGGCHCHAGWRCRCANRGLPNRNEPHAHTGFRVVMESGSGGK